MDRLQRRGPDTRPGDKPRSNGRRRHPLAVAALALLFTSSPTMAEPPFIDHQEIPCSLPEAHSRVCATIADDGTVRRAKLFFRAAGQTAWYWTEMAFDLSQFCATLPKPDDDVEAIEYYLWAMDDEFETERTRDQQVDLDRGCPHPVIDDDAERTANLEVHATIKKQRKKLRGFALDGVTFHPVSR